MRCLLLQSIKIILSVVAAILVLLGLMLMTSQAMETVAELTGIGFLAELNPFLLLLIAFIILPGRFRALPIPFTRTGSVEIDAPATAVWPRVQPRPGNPYHATLFSHIEPVPDADDEVRLHVESRFVDGNGPRYLHARIVEEVPARKVALRYCNARAFPLFAGDIELSEVFIDPLSEDRCRVTFVEHAKRFRLSSILMFVHLNPAKDAAIRLKAQCEGTPDMSWMGQTTRAIGPDGEPPEEMKRSFQIAGVTAIVTSTALLALVLWLVARVAAGQ